MQMLLKIWRSSTCNVWQKSQHMAQWPLCSQFGISNVARSSVSSRNFWIHAARHWIISLGMCFDATFRLSTELGVWSSKINNTNNALHFKPSHNCFPIILLRNLFTGPFSSWLFGPNAVFFTITLSVCDVHCFKSPRLTKLAFGFGLSYVFTQS